MNLYTKSCINSNNSIITTYHLLPLIDLLNSLNQNDLCIFDVDEVLFMPNKEHDFRNARRQALLEYLQKKYPIGETRELLESIILANREQVLLDEMIYDIFAYLRLNSIPTIALTAMGTGKFGIIEHLEDLRIQELEKFNLSFANLTPLNGTCLAPELRNSNMIFPEIKGIPMLTTGIILTAGVDKGVVLEYILNKYNYKPERIIFIDDYLENLRSVRNLCTNKGIKFIGFDYRAAGLVSLPAIDYDLEELRFKILEEQQRWLSYKELQALSNNQSF